MGLRGPSAIEIRTENGLLWPILGFSLVFERPESCQRTSRPAIGSGTEALWPSSRLEDTLGVTLTGVRA